MKYYNSFNSETGNSNSNLFSLFIMISSSAYYYPSFLFLFNKTIFEFTIGVFLNIQFDLNIVVNFDLAY